MSRVILQPKYVGETKTYNFDFTYLLASSETISTQAVTASVYSGVDSTPSSIINGSATLGSVTTTVNQSITGGVVGVIYTLICTITTSAGQTLQLSGFLSIIDQVV